MTNYSKTMAESLMEVRKIEEATMKDSQIAQLKKAYEPMRGKKISTGNAQKLSKMMGKFTDNRQLMIQLVKADIPFVSSFAITKLISKHNMKGAEINKLKKEEVWIRQGIKARRTRNEGRVRALQKLRSERAKRIGHKDVKLTIDSGISSGKIVKEAINVSKSIDGTLIISDLNLIIQRGDRIGLLGPNGCGKTTLLKVLLEHEPIDSGIVKTGTKLEVAYFDQIRDQLDPEQSVMDYITEGREFVTINGKDLHFVSYLSNFLFSPDQSRAAIRTLSGGEQNRLLLARLFSMPTNFLVLD